MPRHVHLACVLVAACANATPRPEPAPSAAQTAAAPVPIEACTTLRSCVAACVDRREDSCWQLGDAYWLYGEMLGQLEQGDARDEEAELCRSGVVDACLAVGSVFESTPNVVVTPLREACADGDGHACFGLSHWSDDETETAAAQGRAAAILEDACLAHGELRACATVVVEQLPRSSDADAATRAELARLAEAACADGVTVGCAYLFWGSPDQVTKTKWLTAACRAEGVEDCPLEIATW